MKHYYENLEIARAVLARVEALADEYEQISEHFETEVLVAPGDFAEHLRAALSHSEGLGA